MIELLMEKCKEATKINVFGFKNVEKAKQIYFSNEKFV